MTAVTVEEKKRLLSSQELSLSFNDIFCISWLSQDSYLELLKASPSFCSLCGSPTYPRLLAYPGRGNQGWTHHLLKIPESVGSPSLNPPIRVSTQINHLDWTTFFPLASGSLAELVNNHTRVSNSCTTKQN